MATYVLVHGAWHGGWCWRDTAAAPRVVAGPGAGRRRPRSAARRREAAGADRPPRHEAAGAACRRHQAGRREPAARSHWRRPRAARAAAQGFGLGAALMPASIRSITKSKNGFDDIRASESMLTIRMPRSPRVAIAPRLAP